MNLLLINSKTDCFRSLLMAQVPIHCLFTPSTTYFGTTTKKCGTGIFSLSSHLDCVNVIWVECLPNVVQVLYQI